MSLWKQKIEYDVSQNDEDDDDVEVGETVDEVHDTGYERYDFCRNQILTIGCCGEVSFHPPFEGTKSLNDSSWIIPRIS